MFKNIDERILAELDAAGLRDYGYQTVFHGGFIRDILLGRKWKDIDVTCAKFLAPSGNWQNIPQNKTKTLNGVIFNTYVITLKSGVRVDVKEETKISDCKTVAMRNQVNICQCAWSLQEGLWISPAFLEGVQEKRIWVDSNIDNWHKGTDRENDHLNKMKTYFPEWKFINSRAKITTAKIPEIITSIRKNEEWDS